MDRALVCWFTGLSGSGKSTVAMGTRAHLEGSGYRVRVLDGDALRAQYPRPLGFSPEDIRTHSRLVAARCVEIRSEVDVILVPIIAPHAACRAEARALLAPEFIEVYCDAGLPCVMQRDVKGLYARAARGELSDLIGYSPGSPYEVPIAPDLTLHTGVESVACSVTALEACIRRVFAQPRRAEIVR